MCPSPVGEKTPQVDIPGPKNRRWGGLPHCRFGMTPSTHLANGEGCCPHLCGPDKEQSNRESPGAPLAQPTKGKEREVERERLGKEEEEGHRVVRGRWAPQPIEEKGRREGQRMAIGTSIFGAKCLPMLPNMTTPLHTTCLAPLWFGLLCTWSPIPLGVGASRKNVAQTWRALALVGGNMLLVFPWMFESVDAEAN